MSGNVIRLICPNLTCRTILSVPSAARGKDVRCRSCGTKLRIPMAKAAPNAVEHGELTPPSGGDKNTTAA